MKLITNRLILREINMKDAKSISGNAHDPIIWHFTSSIPYPYTLKDAKKFIRHCEKERRKKQRENYELGIELKSEKKVIGMISLIRVDKENKKAEIGYWMGKNYRRKGLVSESEKAILEFGFKKLKLNKIYGFCITKNKGSIKLFKKFCFKKEGCMREHMIRSNKKLGIENKKVDVYAWGLLRKDYQIK